MLNTDIIKIIINEQTVHVMFVVVLWKLRGIHIYLSQISLYSNDKV